MPEAAAARSATEPRPRAVAPPVGAVRRRASTGRWGPGHPGAAGARSGRRVAACPRSWGVGEDGARSVRRPSRGVLAQMPASGSPSRAKPPTIADVARAAEVSRTTVSHALNGLGKVDPRTRERVKRIALELGYRPNLRAQRLRTGQAKAIALVSSMPFAVAGGPPGSASTWRWRSPPRERSSTTTRWCSCRRCGPGPRSTPWTSTGPWWSSPTSTTRPSRNCAGADCRTSRSAGRSRPTTRHRTWVCGQTGWRP